MTGTSNEGDAPAGPSFSAYVLFSEAVQFNSAEIEAAVMEDYPSLDIGEIPIRMSQDCDTADFVTVPLFFRSKGADVPGTVSLTRLPGYGQWSPDDVRQTARLRHPDLDAALARNASYLSISVSAERDDLTAAFRAARLCSCIAAVFAKLPVALAIYWETGDHFLSPENVVTMADEAVSDGWPVHDWIGVEINPLGHDETGQFWCRGHVKGLAPFRGFEIIAVPAPIDPGDLLGMVLSACTLTLVYGSVYKDGDTMSQEGAEDAPKWRLRLSPAGTQGAERDNFLLVHPDSRFDADEVLGETTSVAPPTGESNKNRGKPGFFKRLIRGRRDS